MPFTLRLRRSGSRAFRTSCSRTIGRCISLPGFFCCTSARAVVLTLTNPPTIVSFAAIFAALAPRTGFDAGVATVTVAGVFTGSILWWLLLAVVVTALRHALGARARRFVDRVSATLLALFGIAEVRRSL